MSTEISLSDIRRLAAVCELPAITVYLPGPGRLGNRSQTRSRFRELLDQSERTVRMWWTDAVRAKQLLAPARELLNGTTLDDLGSSTLACFLTSRGMSQVRIPTLGHELIYIGPHLHLTPLMPFIEMPNDADLESRMDRMHNFLPCTEMDRIFSAIHNDRVELLGFVPDREMWGTYGENHDASKVHPSRQDDDECLINLLFILAILRGTPWGILSDQNALNPLPVRVWLTPDANKRILHPHARETSTTASF
ncbi:hypothetical protein [Rubinisphaera margarita]|uniref:hypothetical protein n=1 Tax=Rubinisphaera margarita TaxID=2909586 RepID=UPI001EE7B752|nr:hypothetical protein [Rubinisphaera margarita]MCG6156525.1 hypothetical protein [Rubinisphaera margarita]